MKGSLSSPIYAGGKLGHTQSAPVVRFVSSNSNCKFGPKMKAEAPGSETSSNSVGGALEDSSMVYKVQLMTMDQQNKTQKCVIFTPRFRPQILDADTNWIT